MSQCEPNTQLEQDIFGGFIDHIKDHALDTQPDHLNTEFLLLFH